MNNNKVNLRSNITDIMGKDYHLDIIAKIRENIALSKHISELHRLHLATMWSQWRLHQTILQVGNKCLHVVVQRKFHFPEWSSFEGLSRKQTILCKRHEEIEKQSRECRIFLFSWLSIFLAASCSNLTVNSLKGCCSFVGAALGGCFRLDPLAEQIVTSIYILLLLLWSRNLLLLLKENRRSLSAADGIARTIATGTPVDVVVVVVLSACWLTKGRSTPVAAT